MCAVRLCEDAELLARTAVKEDEVVPLLWLTVRVVGTVLAPFAVLTAFMAFAPHVLGTYPAIIGILSIGIGFAACYPRRWNTKAALLRFVYVGAMFTALGWWAFFAAGMYFPDAWRSLGIGHAGPGPFP
jgi:hypothetical protein